MAFSLIQPIIDNKQAFLRLYPDAWYAGDIGDPDHESGPSEHNAYWHEDGRNTQGFVYAQDLGQKGNSSFDLPNFTRWLLDQLRAGRYPEVKYIISRHPANAGTGYYGLFDVRYGWQHQSSSGHGNHIHISYNPYIDHTRSSIVADWHSYQTGGLVPPEEEDDMPQFDRGDIPKGFGWDHAVSLAVPPSNGGAVGWGQGHISFSCDGGTLETSKIKLRVAVHAENNGWIDIREILVTAGGNREGFELPTNSGKITIFRIPVEEGDTTSKNTPGGWLLEYGKR